MTLDASLVIARTLESAMSVRTNIGLMVKSVNIVSLDVIHALKPPSVMNVEMELSMMLDLALSAVMDARNALMLRLVQIASEDIQMWMESARKSVNAAVQDVTLQTAQCAMNADLDMPSQQEIPATNAQDLAVDLVTQKTSQLVQIVVMDSDWLELCVRDALMDVCLVMKTTVSTALMDMILIPLLKVEKNLMSANLSVMNLAWNVMMMNVWTACTVSFFEMESVRSTQLVYVLPTATSVRKEQNKRWMDLALFVQHQIV